MQLQSARAVCASSSCIFDDNLRHRIPAVERVVTAARASLASGARVAICLSESSLCNELMILLSSLDGFAERRGTEPGSSLVQLPLPAPLPPPHNMYLYTNMYVYVYIYILIYIYTIIHYDIHSFIHSFIRSIIYIYVCICIRK